MKYPSSVNPIVNSVAIMLKTRENADIIPAKINLNGRKIIANIPPAMVKKSDIILTIIIKNIMNKIHPNIVFSCLFLMLNANFDCN